MEYISEDRDDANADGLAGNRNWSEYDFALAVGWTRVAVGSRRCRLNPADRLNAWDRGRELLDLRSPYANACAPLILWFDGI
jgi:hypothetical protein